MFELTFFSDSEEYDLNYGFGFNPPITADSPEEALHFIREAIRNVDQLTEICLKTI